jgi:hypothetical protein
MAMTISIPIGTYWLNSGLITPRRYVRPKAQASPKSGKRETFDEDLIVFALHVCLETFSALP